MVTSSGNLGASTEADLVARSGKFGANTVISPGNSQGDEDFLAFETTYNAVLGLYEALKGRN